MFSLPGDFPHMRDTAIFLRIYDRLLLPSLLLIALTIRLLPRGPRPRLRCISLTPYPLLRALQGASTSATLKLPLLFVGKACTSSPPRANSELFFPFEMRISNCHPLCSCVAPRTTPQPVRSKCSPIPHSFHSAWSPFRFDLTGTMVPRKSSSYLHKALAHSFCSEFEIIVPLLVTRGFPKRHLSSTASTISRRRPYS